MHRLQTSAPVDRHETTSPYAEPEPSADPFQLKSIAPPAPMPAVTPIAKAAPMAAPAPAPPSAIATPTFGVESEEPQKSKTVPIVIAAVVALALIGRRNVLEHKATPPAAAAQR